MIRLRVSFVLRLIDDYTGAVADSGHLFLVDGHPAYPVRKAEGYYVFLEPRGPCEIEIQSARYSTRTLQLDPAAQKPNNPVYPVRLLRRMGIRFPDCGRLEGKAPPGVVVCAFLSEDPPLLLRSMKDQVLSLGSYTAKSLCGLRFSVGAGATREFFVMEEKLPDGSWRIGAPFAHHHGPGEEVQRVSACLSTAGGQFALCVQRGVAPGEIQYFDKEAGTWVCLSVPAPS